MATSITIRTGNKAVEVSACPCVAGNSNETVYQIPANTEHSTAIPDGWALTVSDVDAA